MIRYLSLLTFTEKGIANVGQTCQRAANFRKMVEAAGGRMVATYWSLGEFDGAIIFEAPDEATGTSLLLNLVKLGNVRTSTLRVFDESEFQSVVSAL